MPFVPAIIAALGTFAKLAAASIVLKLFIIGGVALASSVVVLPLLEDMLGEAQSAFGAIPYPYSAYMAICKVDVGMSMLISATMARATLGGINLVARTVAG